MPKIVDHDARRRLLVETAWRLMAQNGPQAATLRDVAEAAGFSNGAIKPYFPTKAELLEATFSHVFERTATRVEQRVDGLTGWRAIEAFAREVLPLTTETRAESRVVMSYWALAIEPGSAASLVVEQRAQWRRQVADWLAEAIAAGEMRSGISLSHATEALLTFFEGTQAVGALDPVGGGADALWGQLQALLSGWRPTSHDETT